jgi:hypothetical protein
LGSLSENASGGKNDEFIFISFLLFIILNKNRDKIWK